MQEDFQEVKSANPADNVNANASEQAPKRNLGGISSDTVAQAGIPIPAPFKMKERVAQYPNGYSFPLVHLVKVAFDGAKDVNRNGVVTPTPVINFIFKTAEGKQFTHVEFPVDDADAKFDEKLTQLHQRVKHIFDNTIGAVNFVNGSMDGETFSELFSNIEKAFNQKTVTKGEKSYPLYSQTLCYFKVTYYKTRLQLPLYPNFIQRAKNGEVMLPCELIINPQYDKLEAEVKATPNAQYSGGTNNSFGASIGDDDFPEL